ncbi:MAG: hypothetical protein ACTSQW_01830, partial [Promethearchaeota archaeon]
MFKNIELLNTPLIPNFWRAPTDNDLGKIDFGKESAPSFDISWKDVSKNRVVKTFSIEKVNPSVLKVLVLFRIDNSEQDLSILYTIHGDGSIIIKNSFKPSL